MAEFPAATLPVALRRLLPSVCPLVHLQVEALGVDFFCSPGTSNGRPFSLVLLVQVDLRSSR